MSAMNNEDGVGSTFYMEFPSTSDKNSPAQADTDDSPSKVSSDRASDSMHEGMAQDFDTNDMTILFVSADKQLTESFSVEFDEMYKLILTAQDGNEAVNLLKSTDIDLVVVISTCLRWTDSRYAVT